MTPPSPAASEPAGAGVRAPRPWSPPADSPIDPARIPALNGSRLFLQPRHRAIVDRVQAFLADPRPASLEVGFDHGMCLVDRARTQPDTLHLGVEIREARVDALQPHVPPNALALRADARGFLADVVPAGRLAAILVLFPDPVWTEAHRASRLLFSPAFVALCRRALAPGGVVHLATDVEAYHAWVTGLFARWTEAAAPPRGTALSRRERVCRRDGLPVWSSTWCWPDRGPATGETAP